MPGIMDILQQLLGGNQQGLGALGSQQGMQMPQGGFMTQQQSNPLRDFSLGLLKANQPSPYKKNWLGLASEAVLNANDMQQQRQQQQARMMQTGQVPSAIQEYQYFQALTPEQKKEYLATRRAPTTVNLGGSYGVVNPMGGLREQFAVTPKPEQMPEFKAAQKYATETGKSEAERAESLRSQESKLPQLMRTIQKLSDLGKKATYTTAGQMTDSARRQLGLPVGEGAVARTEYQALVDNQILPLLRDTFGAQFTEREGQSLKATLGDVNKSPEEKDAVLRSFIDQKLANLESTQRGLSMQGGEVPLYGGQQSGGNNAISYQEYFK